MNKLAFVVVATSAFLIGMHAYNQTSLIPPIIITVFLAVYFVTQLIVASLRPMGVSPDLELVALAFANVTLVNALVLGILWWYSRDPAYGVPAILLSIVGTVGLLVLRIRRDSKLAEEFTQTRTLLDEIEVTVEKRFNK